MMKKIALITVALSCFNFTAEKKQEQILINNPYANAIKAGMLPKNAAKEKVKLLQNIAKKVSSMAPYLPLIESYYESNDLKKIITLLKTKKGLEKLIIENGKTGLIVVKTYIKLKQNDKAKDLLIKLNKKHPTDQEVAFLTAQFYENNSQIHLKNKKVDKSKQELYAAISIVNKYLNSAPKRSSNFAFLFLRSRLYLKLGQKEKALKDIEDALEMQPQFEMGWFVFAQLKEKKGEIHEAINGYSNYLDMISSKPRNIAGQILFKAIEAKLLKLMFMQIIKKHPTFDQKKIKYYKQKIMNLFNKNKYKEALKTLEDCLSGESFKDEKRLVKIQILSELKRYKEAGELVKVWILENPDNSLWFEALHILYHTGLDSESVVKILQDVEKKKPNHLLTALYLSDILTRTGNSKKAITYHKKALKLTDNDKLKTSIIYQLGILYYETKQWTKMQSILEYGQSLGLEYAPLLNLLAYHHTTKENKLEKAEKLMQTVLKKHPNNPHFLDTQALILYKQKRYEEAEKILERIIKKEPYDETIVKHLAKTYQKRGKKNKAIRYIKQAEKLTCNKEKKKKYQEIARKWENENDEQKKHTMLCCR